MTAELTPAAPEPVQATCPVCGTAIVPTLARCCERCDTPHHNDCWDYAGGCAIFGCGSASRSRDLSLSSSSLSSSPSPPTFHRWLWLYRLHAQGLAVVALTGATIIVTPVLSYPLSVLFAVLVHGFDMSDPNALQTDFNNLVVLAMLLMGLVLGVAGLVMAATHVPAFLLQRRAEQALTTGLTPPREGVRAVLDRLECTATSRWLLRVLLRASPVAAVLETVSSGALATGAVLWFTLGPHHWTSGVFLFGFGVMGFMAARPLTTAHDRMVWAETLQNRVAASFKNAKGD